MIIDWSKSPGKNWALYNIKTGETIHSEFKPHESWTGIKPAYYYFSVQEKFPKSEWVLASKNNKQVIHE